MVLRILTVTTLTALFVMCVLAGVSDPGGATGGAAGQWVVASLLTGVAAVAAIFSVLTHAVRERHVQQPTLPREMADHGGSGPVREGEDVGTPAEA